MADAYNLVADGTLTLYGRVMADWADDDVSAISFNTDVANLKTGKNGNTIFTKNEQGRNGDAIIRLLRGSSDDQFMQSKLDQQQADFATAELATGEFVLRIGNGAGAVISDTYTLKGGLITRPVDGKENVSGDTTQGVSIYNVKFASARRSIR